MPVNAPARPQRQAALVADVGGSNARFGWAQGGRVCHISTLPVQAHAGLAEAARSYLQGLAAELGPHYRAPRAAAIAVASAVSGDRVALTNSPWCFSRAAVQADLGLDQLLLLNDFEALALSLPGLQPGQLRAHGPLPQAAGTLAVIGPGTGLGVAGVVQTRAGWQALPGEGGHASLAPADDFEAALLAQVRLSYPHVSAERLLSGIGLPVLHQALAAVLGQAVAVPLSAERIVEQGLVGGDALSSRCLDVFCALLGGFAGSVALTLGARGGVYIGGGIVPRLGERFFASAFRERFEAKGRLRPYLQQIPTALITDTLAALGGAALAVEQLDG